MNDYCKDTLNNGLRVITVEMPHLHSAEMVFYVGVGGRHEDPGLAGISHFLEHMLFRSTAEYPSSLHLEQAFEMIGGMVNASTDIETTCYHSRIHPGRIDEGIALFASMIQRPLFRELEIERRIVLEEALEDLNEEGEDINCDNLTASLLWPDSPLSLPTVGTSETIGRIGVAHLQRHHETFYTPANSVLVVAGRIRRGDVAAAAERHFGGWRRTPPPLPALWHPDGAPDRAQTAWVRDSDSQVSLQLAFRTPGRQNDLAVPLRVVRRLLSWGGTSRLMLRLRERLGLTYHVEANLSLFAECGCLSVDLAIAPENLVPALGETLAILKELCQEPVGAEELERAVRSYLYDLEFSRDHPDDLAIRYGWGELVGYLRTLEEDRRDIAAIEPESLLRAARTVFAGACPKMAVVGPYREQDRRRVEDLMTRFSQN